MSWIFIVESVRSKFLQDLGNYGISALEVHWTDYIYLKSLFTVYRVSITLPLSLLNPEPDSTQGQLISCWRVKVGIAAAGPAIGKQSSCKGPVFGLEPASTQNFKKQKLWFFYISFCTSVLLFIFLLFIWLFYFIIYIIFLLVLYFFISFCFGPFQNTCPGAGL